MAEEKRAAHIPARGSTGVTGHGAPVDATALLEADHRQAMDWFEQFERARVGTHKEELALRICQALRMHMQIEEEIFYPAFREAARDTSTHHEAEIEHESARRLIAEIETSAPEDEYFDAKVRVLSEMIKHHVDEEEKHDGMFAKARESNMDLGEIGVQLAARKAGLAAVARTGAWAGRGTPPPNA